MMYEDEADVLDSIQKKILNISAKEEPFDIFICYKENDSAGNRTEDSVLAQQIYNELTQEGFRVFFSRITLENRLGADYEPIIYAALTSSKVMIVVTTDSEHCNAVWVKNEWKRFLELANENHKKVLIPVYKGISPYSLPDEFARLQAQDMTKIGAMQDLLHGIKKIIKQSNNYTEINEEKIQEIIEKRNHKKFFPIKIIASLILLVLLLLLYSLLLSNQFNTPDGLATKINFLFGINSVDYFLVIIFLFYCAMVVNIFSGFKGIIPNALYKTIAIISSITLMLGLLRGFHLSIPLVVAFSLLGITVVTSDIYTFIKSKVKLVIILSLSTIICGLPILLNFTGIDFSNKIDSSVKQIEIIRTSELYTEATYQSMPYGYVNAGETFTVLGESPTKQFIIIRPKYYSDPVYIPSNNVKYK